MKVKDLIAHLSLIDPELMVVRPGYEGGVTEVDYVTIIPVFLNVNKETWYYGEHEQVDEYSTKEHKDAPRANVVELE